MAIAKICKLNLVAMSYDKDAILNALSRSNAVEVKTHKESDLASVGEVCAEDLKSYLSGLESALSVLSAEVENYEKPSFKTSDFMPFAFS